jgi:two-component system, cell cycle response regulator DivK
VTREFAAEARDPRRPAKLNGLAAVHWFDPIPTAGGDAMVRRMIAVVEDNADNRLLVRALLDDRYDITEYATGIEALNGLRRATPDLVLLDISLPEMDGMKVAREIRADEHLRHLPLVALTAHAMSGDRQRFLDAGFDSYVAKPIIDEQQLLGTISALLAQPSVA